MCKTHGKKIWGHFLKFASLVFLDITHDCSLGPCVTSSETSKKIFWPKLGLNRPKSGPKLGFPDVVWSPVKLAYFQYKVSFFHSAMPCYVILLVWTYESFCQF